MLNKRAKHDTILEEDAQEVSNSESSSLTDECSDSEKEEEEKENPSQIFEISAINSSTNTSIVSANFGGSKETATLVKSNKEKSNSVEFDGLEQNKS